jgi:hypothetical protein
LVSLRCLFNREITRSCCAQFLSRSLEVQPDQRSGNRKREERERGNKREAKRFEGKQGGLFIETSKEKGLNKETKMNFNLFGTNNLA